MSLRRSEGGKSTYKLKGFGRRVADACHPSNLDVRRTVMYALGASRADEGSSIAGPHVSRGRHSITMMLWYPSDADTSPQPDGFRGAGMTHWTSLGKSSSHQGYGLHNGSAGPARSLGKLAGHRSWAGMTSVDKSGPLSVQRPLRVATLTIRSSRVSPMLMGSFRLLQTKSHKETL